METLPNRSRYQSFAVKVYVVADVADYDVGETMMADDADALTVEATVSVVVVVV